MSIRDPFIIRQATLADLPELVKIEQNCFAIPWSEQSLRSDLENPGTAFIWVAEILPPGDPASTLAPGVVGYIACYKAADLAQINNLAVLPSVRQKGIGRRLLAALLTWAADSGVSAVDLEVRPSNQAAIAVYAKAGFEVVGKRPHYYEDNGEDANIMLKKIGQ